MGAINSSHLGLASCVDNAGKLTPLASPTGDVDVDFPSKFNSVTVQTKNIL